MNLMNLLRLVLFLSIAAAAVALGAGILGVGARRTAVRRYYVPSPSFHEVVASARQAVHEAEGFYLVDGTTGLIDPFPVPDADRWELFSVSPWRDREGKLEAVGRWVARTSGEGVRDFGGIGVFGVPDAIVKSRISLDVLPTGRPCWIPDRPREFLFPAGDGRLYRFRIADDPLVEDIDFTGEHVRKAGERDALPRALVWKCARPGGRDVFLSDPVWPSEPRLRRYVFVALSRQVARGKKMVFEASKLWWLEISEQSDSIVAAGTLTRAEPGGAQGDGMIERLPSIAADLDGKMSLVYLTRKPDDASCQLRAAALEIDGESGKPRLSPASSTSHVLDAQIALAPLMVSADGRKVYASSADGRIVNYSIPQ
jgi:hypothetical protein